MNFIIWIIMKAVESESRQSNMLEYYTKYYFLVQARLNHVLQLCH